MIDENLIRHLPEPDRTTIRRVLLLLGRDAMELSGPDLQFAREQAGLSLRRAANAIWPGGPEDSAVIALATVEHAAVPKLDPADADVMNRIYGLRTKPL